MTTRLVVDTGPLLEGFGAPAEATCLVPPEVLRELERHGVTHFEVLSRGLVTAFASKVAVAAVREAAHRTGDAPVLSDADVAVLALAAEHDAVLVTDDYAVQNVATVLKLEVRPFGRQGIARTLTWEWYCAACWRHVGTTAGACPVCATDLKRRPRRQR